MDRALQGQGGGQGGDLWDGVSQLLTTLLQLERPISRILTPRPETGKIGRVRMKLERQNERASQITIVKRPGRAEPVYEPALKRLPAGATRRKVAGTRELGLAHTLGGR